MKETIYTYYRIDFSDCGCVDYDYTICKTLEDVLDYLKMIDTDLDDPERSSSATITGVGMTHKEYDDWLAENIKED